MDAVTRQESHGDGMARSSKGALGSTQLEPGTAQEMAQKLGLPFRPDMLQSNDPAAKAYQRALGQAYLQQGYDETGNVADALRYYHGGPNRSMWGPKTQAYAQNVLGRLGVQ
jgi:soluble lytic murein transglycosylase